MPALSNPSPAVRVQAIAAIAGEPGTAVLELGPLLSGEDASVRAAAAQALGAGAGVAERAAALLIAAIERSGFAALPKEEQALFFRSLGRLGSTAGFGYLCEALSVTKGLFKKRPAEPGRLLAVIGLAEELSTRAVRALEAAADPRQGQPAAVAAAARAALQRLRTPQPRGAPR